MANSKIYLGSTNIGSLFQGADDISIYLGENKVYPLAKPKWVATYSDSSVTSAECDSSSEIVETEINLTNLVSVEIGDCVTSIGHHTFGFCDSLTSCTIPNSVTEIGSNAFYSCTSLTSITVNAATPPTLETSSVFYNTNDCPIIVPCESVNAYKSASGWSDYASRITCIEPPVFQGKWKATYSDSSVTSAECGSSSAITRDEINLSNLVSVEIGDCVTSIGNTTFRDCSSLTSIDIPNSVTSIDYDVFRDCTGLTSCTIGDSVTSIDNNVFTNCSSLTSITIPYGLTSIGDYAFQSCSSLNYIAIPNSVTSIGYGVFDGCTNLTSAEINSNSAVSVFRQNTTINKIILGDSVTSIGDYAFQSCSSLEYIDISKTVTSIGRQAFSFCSSLSSVDLPSGVTSIGNMAFFNCSSLTSITVNATTPPTLEGWGAFDETNNCPIYVPGESLYMYMTASGWSNYSSRLQAIY